MTIKLDRPMRPEEMDWMARFRSDVSKLVAKASQRQFDRRFTRQADADPLHDFPKVG